MADQKSKNHIDRQTNTIKKIGLSIQSVQCRSIFPFNQIEERDINELTSNMTFFGRAFNVIGGL